MNEWTSLMPTVGAPSGGPGIRVFAWGVEHSFLKDVWPHTCPPFPLAPFFRTLFIPLSLLHYGSKHLVLFLIHSCVSHSSCCFPLRRCSSQWSTLFYRVCKSFTFIYITSNLVDTCCINKYANFKWRKAVMRDIFSGVATCK